MKNKNLPQIRFEGFEEEWEQRKLGEIVKEVIRTDPVSEAPIMMITANKGFIKQSERYTFNNAGESLKKYILLKNGELAYNHGASKLRPYGSCFALTTTESARVPFVYHCFSAENQNAEFMSIELNGVGIESQLRKIVSSGARMDGLLNISFEEYTSVSVLLPKTGEQDHLADFFRYLDQLITLQKQKYEKLLDIKKSMLDKLFPQEGETTPEIRFKGFNDPWEQRKLGEIIQTLPFKQFLKEHEPDGKYEIIQQGNEPVIGFANGTPCGDYKDVVIFGDHTLSLYKPQRPFFVATDGVRIVKGQVNIDGYYLLSLLERYKPQSEGYKRYFSILADTDCITTYNTNEQKRIGVFFKHLDKLINLQQRKYEKLINIKKSMLDKLFPQ
ncbi:MAG: restriction endonuclease subunit S [Tissierellia bacterium]|nr:restriction endonuclease subunit S [Tissierellia bacterium]